jgi:hypothetical protein
MIGSTTHHGIWFIGVDVVAGCDSGPNFVLMNIIFIFLFGLCGKGLLYISGRIGLVIYIMYYAL